MIKKMVFTNDPVGLEQPHAGGGCLLPASFPWPKDRTGKDLLHVLTIPADWLIDSQCGWLSLFSPFSSEDPYLHWDELTTEGDNQSVVLFHDNKGKNRDKHHEPLSQARSITLNFLSEPDTTKNFVSKIYGVLAWLQDVEEIADHRCVFAVNGDDLDSVFTEEPGIFSDGMLYVFLRDDFHLGGRPSVQGQITFQFT